MAEQRINWVAVAIGALTDSVGTIAFMSLYGVIAAFVSDMQHLSTSEMEARLQRPAVMVALTIIGLAFTALGGYVAGRVAKVRQLMHGGLVGGAGICLALLAGESALSWYNIAATATMIPCGMLGGRIAQNAQNINSGISDRG